VYLRTDDQDYLDQMTGVFGQSSLFRLRADTGGVDRSAHRTSSGTLRQRESGRCGLRMRLGDE